MPVPAGDLHTPISPQGQALHDLLTEQLPAIEAGAAGHDRDQSFPADVFARFAESGVLGATVPAELGGLGVERLHDVALALLRIGAADASTALALHVQYSRGLTLTYEWRHGTPAAKALAERVLRGMGSGAIAVCGAVKDHHTTVTRMTPGEDGGWHLTGRKTLVSMAPVATHFFVYAQYEQDGRPMLAAPLVSRDAPGLTVLDTWEGMGMRASGTSDIVLDDCPVAADDILLRNPAGTAGDAALAGQTVSSITLLGLYVGLAQAARDLAVATFTRRRGTPSAATRTMLAEIDARLYAARSCAVAALANTEQVASEIVDDPAERGRRMMTPFQSAKLMINRLTLELVNDCVTAVGGAAYSDSHPLARIYRDVRAGWFMQPYTYSDGVDYLSGQALRLPQDNDYMTIRAARPSAA
ncbi:acyl-CoA dehydrogenase family protein [Amycolatopsis sp. CA-126428]|uniref:acyl-CoA dehydrogenase family protein n=1 Tax=Amycolatopsis sp. CA-126428 TaxID=2073158 RepID=UPI000CCFF68B|nr:acyl-CoA dehydrogenase family protein [Amycolatopsis sp. CA-126428]